MTTLLEFTGDRALHDGGLDHNTGTVYWVGMSGTQPDVGPFTISYEVIKNQQ